MGRYPKYISVAELKAKAERSVKKLEKKGVELEPVVIKGRKIAKTWWGEAWNDNLERYVDFYNRVERGKRYVKQGNVIDLKLEDGNIKALVQGSRVAPYEVDIYVNPIGKDDWQKIIEYCSDKLESLSELSEGAFSEDLASLFYLEDGGLFPKPDQISFDCSCPDIAYMCKHVAAVLYGIGNRLDLDPFLLFELRQVDVNDLIGNVVTKKQEELKEDLLIKNSRMIDDEDLDDLFDL